MHAHTRHCPACRCAPSAVGVALVRCCFPFGSPGTSLFGRPGLRYMEVTILPASEQPTCRHSPAGRPGKPPPGTASAGGSGEAGSEAEGGGGGGGAASELGTAASERGQRGSGSGAGGPGALAEGQQQQQPCAGREGLAGPPRRCGVSVGVVESRQGLRMLSNGLHLGFYSGPWEGSMQVRGLPGPTS